MIKTTQTKNLLIKAIYFIGSGRQKSKRKMWCFIQLDHKTLSENITVKYKIYNTSTELQFIKTHKSANLNWSAATETKIMKFKWQSI